MITEEILGFPVDAITYDDIINDLPKYMQAGKKNECD